jgi:hypothetical protein
MFAGTGTLRKPREYARARELRTLGEPLKRIAREIGVSVSTVHAWTRDIELTPAQHERNLRGPRGPQNPEHIARRTEAIRQACRTRRLGYQEQGRSQAGAGDPLHQAGCMLYWAEGSKDRNQLTFANSDVEMLKFFCRFLRESLHIPSEDITIRINAYTGNGLTMAEIERWWLDRLDLPSESLRKGISNHQPTSSSGTRRNKLPHGVCDLRVKRSTRHVQHIFGAIQEYAGFEEPRWVDCSHRRRRGAAKTA